MTQSSLFDAVEQRTRDEATKHQLDLDITNLFERIRKGELWLEANPNHPKHTENERLYWDLVRQHAEKVVQRENRDALRCVVLQLPPGVAYQHPNGEKRSVLRILFNGSPVNDEEMTYAEFEDFAKTVGWVKEAMN